MGNYSFLQIERDEAVGIIKMNRTPSNPINRDFVAELSSAFDELRADSAIKVIVITSALERFFVAGADIKMILAMTEEESASITEFFQKSFQKLVDMEKIIIAAINGFALGGGFELALACDYRFAAKGSYTIGLPETGLGIIPGAGGTQRLVRLIGYKALDLLINRTQLSPEDALALGLVDRLYEPQDLLPESINFAKKLSRMATRALGIAKKAVYRGIEMPLSEALLFEKECFVEVFKTADAKEGLTAFMEKRKPQFKGE